MPSRSVLDGRAFVDERNKTAQTGDQYLLPGSVPNFTSHGILRVLRVSVVKWFLALLSPRRHGEHENALIPHDVDCLF
jgi:hypothetical protein